MIKKVILESVNSVIDNNGLVYPMDNDTAYDGNETIGVPVELCDGEWFDNLSTEDETIVNKILGDK